MAMAWHAQAQATEIVHFAAKNGIKTLDTAHSYDLSQTRLGNALTELPESRRPNVVGVSPPPPS